MTPRLKSYIQVHISPMMTLGRAHGMMMSERASPRHQKLWFNSKAAPRPSRNCSPTTPTIQISEFHSEIQNTSSCMMATKLPKPTKTALDGSYSR